MTARASLFTDQRVSGLPMLAKYKHFKTVCEHTLGNSPTVSSSSFLKLWSSKHGVETLYKYMLSVFCVPAHNIFPRKPSHVLPYRMTTRQFLREVSPTLATVSLLQQTFVIRTFVCIPQQYCRSICIHVECIPNTPGQGLMFVLQDQPASSNSSTWDSNSAFLPAILMSSTYTNKNSPCFSMNK